MKLACLVALALASLLCLPRARAEPLPRVWDFVALLDGRPIGTHRFVLEGDGAAPAVRRLTSDARFEVDLLGIPVYRYHFQQDERWNSDCLESLTARTDDDGKVVEVRAQASNDGVAVDIAAPDRPTAARRELVPGCVMSFAYWNASLAGQRRLLDPASGRLERVDIVPLTATTIDVRGRPSVARGLRIAGLAHPIDVWYSGDEWIGLDTVVGRDRHLSYRLR